MTKKIDDRLDYHLKQVAQLKQKKKQIDSIEKRKAKKIETHKKIIMGASILKFFDAKPEDVDDLLPRLIGLLKDVGNLHTAMASPKRQADGQKILDSWKEGNKKADKKPASER